MTAPHHMRADLCDSHLSTVLGLCRGLATTPSELLDDLPLPIQAGRAKACSADCSATSPDAA